MPCPSQLPVPQVKILVKCPGLPGGMVTLEIDWYIYFSDLPLFLIDNNTRYELVAVFQNSHQSQKVVDKKESSTEKSC